MFEITILIAIYTASILLVRILYHFTKDSNSKFAYFIYKLWDEWYEQQYNSVLGFLLIMLVAMIFAFAVKDM